MLRITSDEWTPSDIALCTGRFDRRQSIREYSRKDCDDLAIAVIGTGKFSAHALQGGGQYPILERSTIAQGAWFASQDWHVVPWIIDRFAAPIAARMSFLVPGTSGADWLEGRSAPYCQYCRKNSNGSNGSAPSGVLGKIGGFYRQ
jgi:hypothetical protein